MVGGAVEDVLAHDAAAALGAEDHDSAIAPVKHGRQGHLCSRRGIEERGPVDLEASDGREGQKGQVAAEVARLRRRRRVSLGQDEVGEPGDGVEEQDGEEQEQGDGAVAGRISELRHA